MDENDLRKVLHRRNTPTSFMFQSDWDSLFFWQRMNWRDFTFIYLHIETDNYTRYFGISFAILGLHFSFDWWRKP